MENTFNIRVEEENGFYNTRQYTLQLVNIQNELPQKGPNTFSARNPFTIQSHKNVKFQHWTEIKVKNIILKD